MEANKVKSGYITSEFPVAFIPTVVSILVLAGVIGETEADQVAELVKQAIFGIIAIASLVSYIMSRTELKKTKLLLDSGVKPEQRTPEVTELG